MTEALPDDFKGITVTVKRMACPVHGEPFRDNWPRGWLVFALVVMQALLGDEQFAKLHKGDVAEIDRLLDGLPACERVSVDVLRAAYARSGIGRKRRCVACGQRRLGSPYTTTVKDDVRRLKHVCFECVIVQGKPRFPARQ